MSIVPSPDIITLHQGTPRIHCEHNIATRRYAEWMQKTAAARPYFRQFVELRADYGRRLSSQKVIWSFI
jgi:hypothetical protein